MEKRLYVIYDRVAEESGPIFEAVNDGVALRNFRGLISRTEGVSPEEYKLFLVGTYDSKTMLLKEEMEPIEVVDPRGLGARATGLLELADGGNHGRA